MQAQMTPPTRRKPPAVAIITNPAPWLRVRASLEALRGCRAQCAFVSGISGEPSPADWIGPKVKTPWESRFDLDWLTFADNDRHFGMTWLQSKDPAAVQVRDAMRAAGWLLLRSRPRRTMEIGSIGKAAELDHWISCLFDLAWHRDVPIDAPKLTWCYPQCYLPHDLEKLRRMRAEGAAGIPDEWPGTGLPEIWFGTHDDAVAASLIAIDWLVPRL